MKKIILITGSTSMLGKTIIPLLKEEYRIISTNHNNLDLLNLEKTITIFKDHMPDFILHLATYSGNIQFNQKYPCDTFLKSSIINLNTLQSAQKCKAEKIISVMSSCCLSDNGNEILYETDIHYPPNFTVESHGYAKRLLDIGSRQIRYQYGINAVTCIPNNMFGPEDSLDLNKSKVVTSLIKRFIDAKNQKSPMIELWGSGKSTRQFLFVEDGARAIVQVIKHYNEPDPINITPPEETSIKELAEKISTLVGYEGEIMWLKEMGDGQLRRKLSDTKMKKHLDLTFTPLDEGLRRTIEWYQSLES